MALFEGDFRGSQLGMTKAFMLLDQDVIINAEKESSKIPTKWPLGYDTFCEEWERPDGCVTTHQKSQLLLLFQTFLLPIKE